MRAQEPNAFANRKGKVSRRRPRVRSGISAAEASALKEVVAEPVLESRLLKKARSGLGKTAHEIPRLRKAREMSTWGM